MGIFIECTQTLATLKAQLCTDILSQFGYFLLEAYVVDQIIYSLLAFRNESGIKNNTKYNVKARQMNNIQIWMILKYNNKVLSVRSKQIMNQVNLLKQYIKTLETENRTKNNERDTLYEHINRLENQNYSLVSQINEIRCDWDNRQLYLREIQQNLHLARLDFENCINDLHQRQAQVANLKYQSQKDAERIIDLETVIKQLRTRQQRTKNQISVLREENRSLRQTIQQYPYNQNNQQKINQLIENYEKVQQIAKDKNKQNQLLHEQNASLEEQVQSLKQSLFQTQNECKKIRKILLKKEAEQNQRDLLKQKFNEVEKLREKQREWAYANSIKQKQCQKMDRQKEDLLKSINLIRQNNKLIQRVTELERQKNVLYAEALSNLCKAATNSPTQYQYESQNPLMVLTACENIPRSESRRSLRNKIDALKHQNEILLENLKI